MHCVCVWQRFIIIVVVSVFFWEFNLVSCCRANKMVAELLWGEEILWGFKKPYMASWLAVLFLRTAGDGGQVISTDSWVGLGVSVLKWWEDTLSHHWLKGSLVIPSSWLLPHQQRSYWQIIIILKKIPVHDLRNLDCYQGSMANNQT